MDAAKTIFKDGLEVTFRSLRSTDEALLKELFYSHSEQVRLHHYLNHVRLLAGESAGGMTTPGDAGFVLGGLVRYEGRERMVCVGRCLRLPGDRAEIAITLHENFRDRGIGAFLMRTLIEAGHSAGVRSFTLDACQAQGRMMALFRKLAKEMGFSAEGQSADQALAIVKSSPASS